MIRIDIKRTKIFDEFSSDLQQDFFSVKRDAVISQIDSLYFSVYLSEADERIKDIELFVKELQDLKGELTLANNMIEYNDMILTPVSFGSYNINLKVPDCYDIFIMSKLPNEDTPRIQIQLRSDYLWSKGEKVAIFESTEHLRDILDLYNIAIDAIKVNRVDYAFHNNCIQNLYSYLSDDSLLKHLKTRMRKYHKVGELGKKIDIDYLAIGQRVSNSVFFRMYNKTKEVIQMNYKGFFLDVWLSEKLISKYDFYVLRCAYESGSFESGITIGRINWYLEFGSDLDLKFELENLLETYNLNSRNNEELNERLFGVLPEITTVTNVEYQTKTKFYKSLKSFLSCVHYDYSGDFLYEDIFKILDCRQAILDYLTSSSVSFVQDKNLSKSDFCSWWSKIRSFKRLDLEPAFRIHDNNMDIDRLKGRIVGNIATLSFYLKHDNDDSFNDDLVNALAALNDNDLTSAFIVSQNGEIVNLSNFKYSDVKKKRKLSLLGRLRKFDDANSLANVYVNNYVRASDLRHVLHKK